MGVRSDIKMGLLSDGDVASVHIHGNDGRRGDGVVDDITGDQTGVP